MNMPEQAGASLSADSRQTDIGRITLCVLVIVGLIVMSGWIVYPFLAAILWAVTIVLATWPVMLFIERHVGGSRALAVSVMTLLLLVILILPIVLAAGAILTNLDAIGALLRDVLAMRLPSPPAWLDELPVVGQGITRLWQSLSNSEVQDLAAEHLAPYAGPVTRWLAEATGSVGHMLLQFMATTLIAAVLYATGEKAGAFSLRLGRRLARERGERTVHLVGQAIRAVALGVVVTALVQSLVGGVGLLVTGLPLASLLTAVMFVLCLVQIGPGLVLIPAIIWLFYSGSLVHAVVLIAFTIVATTVDQFIRPILIRRSADLPLWLIVTGVIGGLITVGILGIFIGPTVLAVSYTLLNAWVDDGEHDKASDTAR